MKLKFLLLSLLALTLLASTSLATENKKLSISGSTTVLPIAQKAAESYMGLHPDIKLTVSGTGSGDGIKALIEGTTDIGNSSRDLKGKELKSVAEKNVEIERNVVAWDCVVVVVNRANPVDNLTLEQLKDIYVGNYKNWKDLGGVDKAIIAINRDVSSGTFEVWLEKVLQGKRFRPDAQMQSSSGAVAQAVAGNKYAIGYIGLAYINKDLKVLSVDGVRPSVASVQAGHYPIARELFMFTKKGGNPAATEFINFIQGADGQRLVEDEGFVPLSHK